MKQYGWGTGVPDPVDVYVGKRLAQLRIKSKVSQEKIAKHLGITFQQFQKYENAKNRISAGRLYRVSLFFGVSISYFFEGYEDQNEPVS